MNLLLEFGPNRAYLFAAYGFVVLSMGGYFASIVWRERALARMEERRRDDG